MYSRAIVLDLDGTVLRSDKTISKETIASLQACKEKNMCIVVATARSEKSAERYISQIKPHAIISNGGSLVTLNGNIIYEKKLSKEITNKIIQKCLKKKTGTITVENTEGYFSNKAVEVFNNLHIKYNDYSEDMSEAYKITVEIENLEVAEEIASTFQDCSMLCFTGEKWKRFAHKNATKIKALDELIRVINIDILVLMKYTDFDIEYEVENYYCPLLKEYFNYDNIHFTFIGLNAFDSVFAEIYIDYEDKIIFDIEKHYDFLMYINKFNRVNENLINLIKKDWESKYGVL